MNNPKYVIPFRIAILVPGMAFAQTSKDPTEDHTGGYYLELLKQQGFYQNMTSEQKIAYE